MQKESTTTPCSSRSYSFDCLLAPIPFAASQEQIAHCFHCCVKHALEAKKLFDIQRSTNTTTSFLMPPREPLYAYSKNETLSSPSSFSYANLLFSRESAVAISDVVYTQWPIATFSNSTSNSAYAFSTASTANDPVHRIVTIFSSDALYKIRRSNGRSLSLVSFLDNCVASHEWKEALASKVLYSNPLITTWFSNQALCTSNNNDSSLPSLEMEKMNLLPSGVREPKLLASAASSSSLQLWSDRRVLLSCACLHESMSPLFEERSALAKNLLARGFEDCKPKSRHSTKEKQKTTSDACLWTWKNILSCLSQTSELVDVYQSMAASKYIVSFSSAFQLGACEWEALALGAVPIIISPSQGLPKNVQIERLLQGLPVIRLEAHHHLTKEMLFARQSDYSDKQKRKQYDLSKVYFPHWLFHLTKDLLGGSFLRRTMAPSIDRIRLNLLTNNRTCFRLKFSDAMEKYGPLENSQEVYRKAQKYQKCRASYPADVCKYAAEPLGSSQLKQAFYNGVAIKVAAPSFSSLPKRRLLEDEEDEVIAVSESGSGGTRTQRPKKFGHRPASRGKSRLDERREFLSSGLADRIQLIDATKKRKAFYNRTKSIAESKGNNKLEKRSSNKHKMSTEALSASYGGDVDASTTSRQNENATLYSQSTKQSAVPLACRLGNMKVEIVVPLCCENKHEISWLADLLSLSTQIRASVYYKCPQCIPNSRLDEWLPIVLANKELVLALQKRTSSSFGIHILQDDFFHQPAIAGRVQQEMRFDGRYNSKESSAYFLHMVQNYESLADTTFFIHADPASHINMDIFERAVTWSLLCDASASDTIPFMHLSALYLGGEWGRPPGWNECRKNLFLHLGMKNVSTGSDYAAYKAGMFVASSQAIQARPVSFWTKLLAISDVSQPIHGCPLFENNFAQGPQIGGHIERLWHVFFGHATRMRRREADTSIPDYFRQPDCKGFGKCYGAV